MNDQDYLRRAVELKTTSAEPVKCAVVMVKGGDVVAETINSQRTDGIAISHAEIKAIAVANKRLGERKLHGVTAYCSCEPCAMCLSALANAQVDRIVFDERMIDIAPDDPLSKLDAEAFVNRYFRRPPKLSRIKLT
jgi:tRNA(adenine34) deaminase